DQRLRSCARAFPTRRSSDLKTRLAQMHVCPEFRNLLAIVWSTARSISASSATTIGAWPPSSIVTAFTVSALSLMSDLPTAVEPRSEEHTSELQSRFDLVCRL